MRSKSAFKNMLFSVILQVFTIAVGFVLPKMIISTYGSGVNGLTSTINQILNILNLLQAGVVGASIYQMYKPVADNDYKEVSLILSSTRHYYKKIGSIFLCGVVLFAPLVAVLKRGENIAFWAIFTGVLILGINASTDFFFVSTYDVLFSSHQKRYILSIATIIDKVLYYSLLFIILYFKVHFIFMYVALLLGSICKIGVLYFVYRRQYMKLLPETPKGVYIKINNKNYLLFEQIAKQSVTSSPTVIVSLQHSLNDSSVYSVYYLIQNMIIIVMNLIQYSLSDALGNLVITAGNEKIKRIYGLVEYCFTVIGAFLISCTSFLFIPFIYTYTGGNGLDVNYLYPALAILMVFYCISYLFYTPLNMLKTSYGLFKKTYMQSIVTGIFTLLLSVGLGFVYWPLVVFGPMIYFTIGFIYLLYISKKNIVWFSLKKYSIRILFVLALTVLFIITGSLLGPLQLSWLVWLLYAVCCAVVSVILIVIYSVVFENNNFRTAFSYLKNMIARKK